MPSETLKDFRRTCESNNLPMRLIAGICGVRPTSLSSALRDEMRLDISKESCLHDVATRLAAIKSAISPFELPLAVGDLKQLLKGTEDDGVSLDEIEGFRRRLFKSE